MFAKSLQSWPALCHPMDCRPPVSSVHGIPQARILPWVAVPFSRGSFRARDQTHASCTSCISGGFFATEPLEKSFCCVLTASFGLPQWPSGEESACSGGAAGHAGSTPGPGRSPGGDSPHYSCLENPHRQRSLASYSSWGHKELDVTEAI